MKPFDLVVYAAVTVVIVFVFFNIIATIYTPPTIVETIKTGLNNAQQPSNLGKTISLGKKEILSGIVISKNVFTAQGVSVALECTSTTFCCESSKICDKEIEWDYTQLRFKRATTIDFYTRCEMQSDLSVCRAYIGAAPAQASVSAKELSASSAKLTATVDIKNTGSISMPPGMVTPILKKKIQYDWINSGQEFEPKETELIKVGEKQTLLFELDGISPGMYKVEFKAEAVNSGFDQNGFEFVMGENAACVADETRAAETVAGAGSNVFYEMHYCAGCNYAYECAAAWGAKTPSINYEPRDTDKTSCTKTTETGSC